MPPNASRRRVLGALGAGLLGAGVTGAAEAEVPGDDTETVQVNVGYSDRSVLTRLRRAGDVVREFAFDVVTLRTPAAVAAELAGRSGVRFVEPDVELTATAQALP
jgi:hypothetical protein